MWWSSNTYIMFQQNRLLFEPETTEITLNILWWPLRCVRDIGIGIRHTIPFEWRTLQFQLPRAEYPRTKTIRNRSRRWLRWRRWNLVFNFTFFRRTVFDRGFLSRFVRSAIVTSPIRAIRRRRWRWAQASTVKSSIAFAAKKNRVLTNSKYNRYDVGSLKGKISRVQLTCSWTSLQTLHGRQSGHFHSDSGTRGNTSWSKPKHFAWTKIGGKRFIRF